MPIPFIMLGAAAMAGAAGVTKGASAISSNSKADHMVKAAQDACQQAQEALEEQRAETTNKLETLGTIKLDIWSKEMHDFVQSFQSFKNVRMEGGPELNDRLRLQIENPDNLKNMEIASIKASEITHAGISALGSGALAGIASYGGAMMFASASTGTAIASLSGVAATNATLAWFGGGSLAAGGLGVAGGTVVLGGIVAGPVLAVAGTLMKAKAEEKLANARQIKAELEQTVEQIESGSIAIAAAPTGQPAVQAAAPVRRAELPKAVPEEIKEIVAKWPQVAGSAQQPMKSYLKNARLSLGGDNRLLLVVEDGLASDYFTKEPANKGALEQLLAELTGKQIEVEVRSVRSKQEMESSYVDLTRVIHMDIEEE